MNIRYFLDSLVEDAMASVGLGGFPAIVKPSQKIQFGHYQANGIMAAAKASKANPRDKASETVTLLESRHGSAGLSFEVAGPGFINITVAARTLSQWLAESELPKRPVIEHPQTYVVDYSSPNLAKEMHIGHLRSTVIGDTVVRVLEYVGHHAIRVNHVGDWGAQFGSLLAYLEESAQTQQAQTAALADLEKFYQEASARFKSDTQFATKARQCVVDLQSGDPHLLALWRQFIETSLDHAGAVYELLNITMQRSDVRAESAYNDALHPLVDRLNAEGLLIESDGAQCVFLDEFKGKDGQTLPAIVQKSDGGFPYLATDLAALDYRANTLKGDHLLYVVGAAQSLHLRQAYAVARAGRLIKDEVETRHLPFGLVLKADGTPFKTRDGADVKLIDVLRESVERAATLIRSRNDGATDQEVKTISEVVGIGAIKYAELQKNRTTDYMFDWDTMLAFEGNTAPYLQYAYTRISSLLAKADRPPSDTVTITEEPETLLGLKILQFDEAVLAYLDDYQANVICQYLYELSGRFMSFYEQCPVLSAADDVAASRLRLAQLTADTLRQGLTLLGIETVDRM